jgi:hypothetical protein
MSQDQQCFVPVKGFLVVAGAAVVLVVLRLTRFEAIGTTVHLLPIGLSAVCAHGSDSDGRIRSERTTTPV